MKINILYKMLLMLSTSILFSSEQLENNIKQLSNIEEEIIDPKPNHQYIKENLKITQSNKIKYPYKKEDYNHKIVEKKERNRRIDQINKKDIKKPENNIVEIRKTNKIYYPQDKTNIQISHSEQNVWYNIKVYPTHKKDRFKKIKELNKINMEIKKDFALIGPILEDNLGEITKALHIRGYNELEYIKIKQN
ncbi:hypothetical protein baBA2_000099 [Borrelia anserina]|uniref:SPOR domain-containing protein n=1 Tax=Borrelia anserina Es TaxID=1365188 RepID=A0ABM6FTK5_BORAN|nr:hypothetical protein [Borrelia anserina]APR64610.1 hypothetical protein N187_00490 [Borrelia anserina Es]UPA06524.1 hypothetical protein baBA2_000099 [Borrelia anserina]